jgi:hypothetical protein
MANLIWTSILYFSTFSIVFVAYKVFVNDRKYENELRVASQILIAQGVGGKTMAQAAAVNTGITPAAPGEAAPAAPHRFVAPPRSARSNTIPANIRRA